MNDKMFSQRKSSACRTNESFDGSDYDAYLPHCEWVNNLQVPDWMLSMKKERGSDRRKRETDGAPRRHSISTVSMHTINKKRRRLSTPKNQTARIDMKQ